MTVNQEMPSTYLALSQKYTKIVSNTLLSLHFIGALHSGHSFSIGSLITKNAHFSAVIFKSMCSLCPQLLSITL